MSKNQFIIDGLEELKRELRQLPRALTQEAQEVVTKTAIAAAGAMRGDYPIRRSNLHPTARRKTPFYPPGNLRKGVRIVHVVAGQFTASSTVQNVAKHAWIYELGTVARHNDTGSQPNRGSMPPTHLFVKTMKAYRRDMYRNLREIVERKGLQVSGDA